MVPRLPRLLQVLLLLVLQDGQAVVELPIRQDVEATAHLLLRVLVADAAECHLVDAVLLSEALLAHLHLNLLPYIVSLLFVLLTDVFVDEALLVLNLHIDRVIHQAITTTIMLIIC